jgi:secondary thiamine-phosphate synthase enzyme
MSAYVRSSLQVNTAGRSIHPLHQQLQRCVAESGIGTGLCHVFVKHTSCSLIITENADPDVHVDLERYLSDLVPDGDSRYRHTAEGPDDMAAHVRSVLTLTELTLPVQAGRLDLGVWQGVYLWEHRQRAQQRDVVVTVQGQTK